MTWKVEIMLRAQSCLTHWDPMNCSPPEDSTVLGILHARTLEWVACSSPGDLLDSGNKSTSPALKMDSLPIEPQGKPRNYARS